MGKGLMIEDTDSDSGRRLFVKVFGVRRRELSFLCKSSDSFGCQKDAVLHLKEGDFVVGGI